MPVGASTVDCGTFPAGATITVQLGGGDDQIFARDGEADSVDCGGGADRAEVDAADVVAGCASVDRPATAGTTDRSPKPSHNDPTFGVGA